MPVNEHDLYALTISLGNTVGTRDDVKSLLPMLLERLVATGELDPGIVLGKLPREQWRTWPGHEAAIDGYLDAVWRSLLAEYPPRVRIVHRRRHLRRRRPSTLGSWLRREAVRDRLHQAFERDYDAPWADDLARAYDLLRT